LSWLTIDRPRPYRARIPAATDDFPDAELPRITHEQRALSRGGIGAHARLRAGGGACLVGQPGDGGDRAARASSSAPVCLDVRQTRTTCQYKGEASYFRVRDSGVRLWTYRHPDPEAAAIAGHLAAAGEHLGVHITVDGTSERQP
jgi:hypothetical protein